MTRPLTSEADAETETDAALTQALYDQAYRLSWRFQQEAERAFEAFGMSPLKALVLRVIARDVHYPKELAELLAAQPSAVSALLGDLEGRGLIARDTDPADRRRVRLELTEDGAAMLAQLEAAWYAIFSARVAALTSQELSALHRIQGKLLEEA